MEEAQVVKSGITWFELSIGRNSKGLDLFFRIVPQLEAFMKSLGDGNKEALSLYGRGWLGPNPDRELEVYNIGTEIASPTWTVNKVAEPLENFKDGRTNLSFLRMVGASEPEGVRFMIAGPYSKVYVKRLSGTLITEAGKLIKEYIVPVNINLRISSHEV